MPHANGTIQLTKRWALVSNDSNLNYNPKQGFILTGGLLGNKTIGTYRCSVLNIAENGREDFNKNKFVLVNVTSNPTASQKATTSFTPVSIVNGTAKVTKENSVYSRQLYVHPGPIIQCCSGLKDNPPKLYMNPCTTPLDCEIKKIAMPDKVAAGTAYTFFNKLVPYFDPVNPKYNPSDCTKAFLIGPSTLVVCKGETVDYVQQLWHTFNPEAGGPVQNRHQRLQAADPIPRDDRDRTISLSKYGTEADISIGNKTQRMAIIVGGDSTAEPDNYPMSFIKMHDPLLKTSENGKDPIIMMDEIEHKMPFAPRIKEYDRDVYYEGESLVLMCFGVQFFYANGPRLRLNWKNGTHTDLENATVSWSKLLQRTSLYLSGDTVMFDGWGDEVVSIFGFPVVASLEMSSVDCWMPVRNSGRWDKISKSLRVLPSIAPRFAEVAEETVRVKVGDVFHLFTCTVVAGTPFPNLKIAKDGKLTYDARRGWKWLRISSTERKDSDVSKSLITANILIKKVKESDQGVWTCLAHNSKGTVKRTVKVIVESADKPVPESILEVDLQ